MANLQVRPFGSFAVKRQPSVDRDKVIALSALALLSLYTYWPTIVSLVATWSNNPQYSHGFLVPVFSGWLLWRKRDTFPAKLNPAPGWGGMLLIASIGMHVFAGWRFAEWPESISILPYLFALTLIFGGKTLALWTAPAIGFLAFMVPLPYRFEVAMGAPLQSLATKVSTFVLQTIGQPAIADGNTILLRDIRLGIVEACSGLKMLVTFLTFATAVCLIVQRPISDKLVILASAVPIAITVNVIRIVLTGYMYLHVSGDAAHRFFHDLAGWFMMPMALLFLGMELWILNRLIVDQPRRCAASGH